jgi:hypothetical protein
VGIAEYSRENLLRIGWKPSYCQQHPGSSVHLLTSVVCLEMCIKFCGICSEKPITQIRNILYLFCHIDCSNDLMKLPSTEQLKRTVTSSVLSLPLFLSLFSCSLSVFLSLCLPLSLFLLLFQCSSLSLSLAVSLPLLLSLFIDVWLILMTPCDLKSSVSLCSARREKPAASKLPETLISSRLVIVCYLGQH